MIIELKDCEAWIKTHPFTILASENDYACSMESYGSQSLLDVFTNYILLDKDEKYICETSLDKMLHDFWCDPYFCLYTLQDWLQCRNAYNIISELIKGDLDACEITSIMYHVLMLDETDKFNQKVIHNTFVYYNTYAMQKNLPKIAGYDILVLPDDKEVQS